MVLLAELGSSGALEVHQLLSGRDVARDRRGNVVHQFAAQMQNFIYVIADVRARRCVLVDAAWDVASVLQLVADKGWELSACVFTHRHFDHCGGRVPRAMTGAAQDIELPGVRDFVERGIECGVGRRDAATVAKQSGVALGALRALAEGDCVVISEHAALRVLDTPGHTPGSICLLLEAGSPGALFTGDTLFLGGRVDLPESNVDDMLKSLARLATLPKDTVVLPGHNYAAESWSTIEEEAATNGMMVQAVRRAGEFGGAKVRSEPVAAQIQLPDYLTAARAALSSSSAGSARGSRSAWGSGPDACCCGGDDADACCADGHAVVNARQLESHF